VAGGVQEENILHRLKPEPGMALVFNHMILHEGERVQSGLKYIMRSVRLPLFKNTAHTAHTAHTTYMCCVGRISCTSVLRARSGW